MSFYPVVSSHHSRDDQPLYVCDDLEIIDEQHINLDNDRDSLTHHIKDNTPQLTQHQHYDDEHKEDPSSSLSPPTAAHLPHVTHLSTAFPFHSPFHAHKHNKSSSSICSLPASPTDVSNEHGGRGGGGGVGSRRVSRSADPATLFLLHRIMKGDVFTLYTPSLSPASSTDAFDATPVFVFYDAHGRLGSLYWTSQRRPAARHHIIHEDDDAQPASSSLSAVRFVRQLSPSHCLPIHTLDYVGHGKPPVLASTLTSSPLSSACFLTLESPTHTLYLSHHDASAVRQWVACLRDIFVQNGHDVRDADEGEMAGDSPHKGMSGAGGKQSAGLLNLFAEPLDGSDDDSGNGSGSGNGGTNSLMDRDSGKRSSLSLSEKSADSDLLDKRKQRKEQLAMCQCTIC